MTMQIIIQVTNEADAFERKRFKNKAFQAP